MRNILTTLFLFVCSAPVFADVPMTGVGEVSTAPNAARFSVGVVAKDKDASKALKTANVATEKLFKVLDDNKIDKKYVATASVNLGQSYDKDGNVNGYQASNVLTITVVNLDKLGDLLGEVVGSGSNVVSGLHFICTDHEALMDQARNLAVADAKRKADLYAKSAGFKLGGVISLSESEDYRRESNTSERVMMADAGPGRVPVSKGERVLRVTVRIVYSIDKESPKMPDPIIRSE